MASTSVHQAALDVLMIPDANEKLAAVARLASDWRAKKLLADFDASAFVPEPISVPGRPDKLRLVHPRDLPRRRGSRSGHGALLHAIAHIEFNAINLALDCVYRFPGLPDSFVSGWLKVAEEEAYHFSLVRNRLHAFGLEYGDLPAHDGLWDMACKTAHDPLPRMALVPRVLEARGLDATPPIIAKLKALGDDASIAVLEIILRDEVGHVALGDYWFRYFCKARGLDAELTYHRLMLELDAPWPAPPLNLEARRQAGFGEDELIRLSSTGKAGDFF